MSITGSFQDNRNKSRNRSQTTFRPEKQTQDHIYTQRALRETQLEKSKGIHIRCLDSKAALDKVPRKYIGRVFEW